MTGCAVDKGRALPRIDTSVWQSSPRRRGSIALALDSRVRGNDSTGAARLCASRIAAEQPT